MIISDEQIKQIANNIVFDVHQYIKEHQKQYEEFLAEEEQKTNNLKSSIINGEENFNDRQC